MKIAIINGPNLNLVGRREPDIYGSRPLDEYLTELVEQYPAVEFTLYQSNSEGSLIDEIQLAGEQCDAIVLNAGAYSHYSLAIADALRSIAIPAIEVHISNIFAREPQRRQSVIAPACVGTVAGFGLDSYRMAVDHLVRK